MKNRKKFFAYLFLNYNRFFTILLLLTLIVAILLRLFFSFQIHKVEQQLAQLASGSRKLTDGIALIEKLKSPTSIIFSNMEKMLSDGNVYPAQNKNFSNEQIISTLSGWQKKSGLLVRSMTIVDTRNKKNRIELRGNGTNQAVSSFFNLMYQENGFFLSIEQLDISLQNNLLHIAMILEVNSEG